MAKLVTVTSCSETVTVQLQAIGPLAIAKLATGARHLGKVASLLLPKGGATIDKNEREIKDSFASKGWRHC
jgi:hypothetical protein